MKTKKINIKRIENLRRWEQDNPDYTPIPLSDTLKMHKYRDMDTVSLVAQRWCGEWTGFGNSEVIASYFINNK